MIFSMRPFLGIVEIDRPLVVHEKLKNDGVPLTSLEGYTAGLEYM